jgi:hypothetical protein
MTDKELQDSLGKFVFGPYHFFKVKLFKRDKRVKHRRSFGDLFLYYRARGVTEKQLLKGLVDAGFYAGICHEIEKVVFWKGKMDQKPDSIWVTGHLYWTDSEIRRKAIDKYTTEYMNKLYKQNF